jgi:hypothetical protein
MEHKNRPDRVNRGDTPRDGEGMIPPPRPRGVPMTRDDRVEPGEPASHKGRLLRRLTAAARDTIFIVLLVAPLIGLSWLVSLGGRGGEAEAGNCSGCGVIVREEVLCLWLPGTLCVAAERPNELARLRTHEELREWLRARNEEDLWYALTSRGHQVNGGSADRTVIRLPGHDPSLFEEFLAVLATAGGNPPRYPLVDFSTAIVRRIPDEIRDREPRDAMVDLLGLTSTPVVGDKPRSPRALSDRSREK